MAETTHDSDTLDGTVTGIVFRNDETGYSVLRVSGGGDGSFSLKLLDQYCGIRIEPSACAGFAGLKYTAGDPNATHIVWATGGGMVPNEEMERYLN